MMNGERLLTWVVLLSGSLFAVSCRSYELKPEARNVQLFPYGNKLGISLLKSIKSKKGNGNSPFSRCNYLGDASLVGGLPRGDTPEQMENDLRNQAAEKSANAVFAYIRGESALPSYRLYRCEGLDSLIAAQQEIDARAEQEVNAANEKRNKELYTKPHYWTICAATGYSNLPPSVAQDMLKQFKQEAFDSENQCADKAWYLSKVGSQLGIQCSCKYVKLER